MTKQLRCTFLNSGKPGVGPFLAAGPVMAALAGAGVGGAAGGLMGALIGVGIPEYAAKRSEGTYKKERHIATIPIGLRKRKIFWKEPDLTMVPPSVKQARLCGEGQTESA